ncbi:MAG: ABC transporter permease [Herpetosiphonaceae bacterium]|nr:ABC transporter permease [Herpetosiphonaceae bacterium]
MWATLSSWWAGQVSRTGRPRNVPLVIGTTLVGLLVLCAVAAPLLAPHPPNQLVYRLKDGLIMASPYPPGTPGLWLGTDMIYHDMVSRLLYASRYTLLFCGVAAMVRICIGAALGLLGGWYPRVGRIVDVLLSVWSAVPSLVIALFLIIPLNRLANLTISTIAYVLVLSITGWTQVAIGSKGAVRQLRHAQFIEAAYTLGLKPATVLRRHILPNVRDLLLVEAAYTMGAALLLVAELAFLGFFVGGTTGAVVRGRLEAEPVYAEWGSMLAIGLRERGKLWLLLEPLIVFTLAILAFNLLAEGLRRRRARY